MVTAIAINFLIARQLTSQILTLDLSDCHPATTNHGKALNG